VSTYIEEGAIKVIELIGVSAESFDHAVKQAVAKASESIIGITGVEVQSMNARVADGEIVQFRAAVKIAFAVR
jgi:flavin-binding protein dodecin